MRTALPPESARAVVWGEEAAPVHHDGPLPGAPAGGAARHSDYVLLVGAIGVLSVAGLLMVLSASSVASLRAFGSPWYYFEHQCEMLLVGALAFLAAWRMNIAVCSRLARPAAVVAVVLLMAVLVHGRSAGGASRWLGVGPLTFQPSEFAKLAFVLFAADVLARRVKGDWAYRAGPVLLLLLGFVILIVLQPDMSTAVLVAALGLAVLYAAGLPLRSMAAIGVTAGVAGLGLAVVAPYRLARLTSFLDPAAHATTTGYQSVQGLIALATGHLTGAGVGQSLASWGYLPNQYTDYIFAVLGQEMGLAGCAFVLVAFGVIGVAGTRVAWRAPSTFESLLAAGVTAWLVLQATINAGAVAGVLPVAGVPLPFVSYGGTSLVIDLFASGLLANVARRC